MSKKDIEEIKVSNTPVKSFKKKRMSQYELLYNLEGLHTVETIMKELNIGKQSALNLISKLKREQHLTVWAGGRKKIYKISIRKQLPRVHGMWDIINKYSTMKLNPWYDHQVHGEYGPEEALVDAIETKSFRVILASMHLFRHIKDWKKVYNLSRKKNNNSKYNDNTWQKICAVYDVTKMFLKVRNMPTKYYETKHILGKQQLFRYNYPTKEKIFLPIQKKWNVPIPFRMGDIWKVKYDNT